MTNEKRSTILKPPSGISGVVWEESFPVAEDVFVSTFRR